MVRDRSVVASLVYVFFIPVVAAQVSAPQQHLVHDRSSRRVVFTGLTPGNLGAAVRTDPRAWHSWVGHARYSSQRPRRGEQESPDDRRPRRHKRWLIADWDVPISGGIGPWAFRRSLGLT
jgi:hypothetical protein